MRPSRLYRPEPRWVALVRQLAGVLTIAGVAITAAALVLNWAIERQQVVVELRPDSTALALYPVCGDAGSLFWFPQRVIPRRRLP